MNQMHWENVYRTKSPAETSWYRPHLELSFQWIIEAAPDRSTPILDVGAGESTLVDDLLGAGYRDVTALDISEAALARLQVRLNAAASQVCWLVGDITQTALPSGFGVWHDRAVFHFLVEPERRAVYVRQLLRCVRPGGHVILAIFGLQGPQKCSGLPTARYDAESLACELGPHFQLQRSTLMEHQTASGATQQFLYCDFIRR